MAVRPEGARATGAQLRAALGLPAGPDFEVTGVTLDSRAVRPGDLYAALPGFVTHGARFADQALAAGAAAVLTDPAGADLFEAGGLAGGPPVLVVPEPRARLGALSALVYGHPSESLTMTGITGTNGKTTTSYLLDAALRADGRRTGIIGTVATHIGDQVLASSRTTPEAPDLHALLAVMRQHDVTAVTMEVSSHALSLGRVDGVRFDVAAWTNLSQDHLDFHGDMDSYLQAKAALFTPERSATAVVCVDDAAGRLLASESPIPVQTASLGTPADWTVVDVSVTPIGAATYRIHGPGGLEVGAGIGLPGRFNIANALLAVAIAVGHGVDAQVAADAIRASPGVPGRMERVDMGQPFLAVVDYAHTPDAVRRALTAVRQVIAGGGGRVIAVMGCGGDRDPSKRPLMGREVASGADVAIITDDNPRSESPAAIRAAIMSGVAQVGADVRASVREEADRGEALSLAVGLAAPGDAVIVLGKGHEQGQEVDGVIHPFDDRSELRRALGGLP